jgi:hypothetical protein
MAGTNQVARLSALTATRSVGVPMPASAIDGSAVLSSLSSSATCSVWRNSCRPVSVAVQGVPRTTSTWPMRCSSSLTRCDTAEGVRCSACAARSKLPSRTTAARASSRE